MNNKLIKKIQDKTAHISVVGLGYVGLPLASAFVNAGYQVSGIDIDPKKVEKLKQGKSYIIDVVDESIKAALEKGFSVSGNYTAIAESDAILICVPTPLNDSKEPDITFIVKAVESIIQYIRKGTLVVLESTTYPGTTEELIINRIERERGYKIGEDFYVCYSPERVDPGNKYFSVDNTPKVIGGATSECTELGRMLYTSFLDKIIPVTSTKVAETTKLLENTFRGVNIALMNEMTIMCERMGVNIWEVIEAAATKPFGFMPFYPGPGIGGHCIPLDPMYLSWEGKKYNYFNRFIELATDINANMPRYVLQQLQNCLNKKGKCLHNSKVLIIGMSYKKDIDDLRESPALEIYDSLLQKGAKVNYYDPYVESFKYKEMKVYSIELTPGNIQLADIIIVITDHTCVDYQMILDYGELVYDTRNVMKLYKKGKAEVILLGAND